MQVELLSHLLILFTTMLFGIIVGRILILVIRRMNKKVEEKITINQTNTQETISAIKIKKNKPQDDSVPFTYTGTTVSNSAQSTNNSKPPKPTTTQVPKERQNPRHTQRTNLSSADIDRMRRLMNIQK